MCSTFKASWRKYHNEKSYSICWKLVWKNCKISLVWLLLVYTGTQDKLIHFWHVKWNVRYWFLVPHQIHTVCCCVKAKFAIKDLQIWPKETLFYTHITASVYYISKGFIQKKRRFLFFVNSRTLCGSNIHLWYSFFKDKVYTTCDIDDNLQNLLKVRNAWF